MNDDRYVADDGLRLFHSVEEAMAADRQQTVDMAVKRGFTTLSIEDDVVDCSRKRKVVKVYPDGTWEFYESPDAIEASEAGVSAQGLGWFLDKIPEEEDEDDDGGDDSHA
jgi:hypothetical protein